jgi:hypothetical protein
LITVGKTQYVGNVVEKAVAEKMFEEAVKIEIEVFVKI